MAPDMKPIGRVPVERVMQKVDDLMAKRDLPGVERMLKYWLHEARFLKDTQGEVVMLGELVGHYRKTQEKEKARESGEELQMLLYVAHLEDTILGATSFINIGTTYNSFGENAEALKLFRRARTVYETQDASPKLKSGLYNNMGLTCAALGMYDEALELYDLAREFGEKVPGGELEMAVTCANRANALEARDGTEKAEEEICALLEEAWTLLHHQALPRDGYMAYVYTTMAPVYSYYGYFYESAVLEREAEELYAGA